jgi:hypothetical protein
MLEKMHYVSARCFFDRLPANLGTASAKVKRFRAWDLAIDDEERKRGRVADNQMKRNSSAAVRSAHQHIT